jgi:hypothetical protein
MLSRILDLASLHETPQGSRLPSGHARYRIGSLDSKGNVCIDVTLASRSTANVHLESTLSTALQTTPVAKMSDMPPAAPRTDPPQVPKTRYMCVTAPLVTDFGQRLPESKNS